MALKIRLRRMGRKKAPTYRLVVAESSMPRDGRFVATIGHYNPRTQPMTLVVDRDKALAWLDKGASPTDTARSLLKRAGVFGPAPTVVESAVESVKTSARNAAIAARNVATQAAAAVSGAASGVVETVQDAVETAQEAVGDAVESVQETVAEAVESVQEAVGEVRERIAGSDDEAAEATAPEADATEEKA